ncbi:MAG: hypothetical protein KAJ90_01410 [Desulfobacterales bacterium]|nr:hypothetical protein [Desulfobacterales bacterium]
MRKERVENGDATVFFHPLAREQGNEEQLIEVFVCSCLLYFPRDVDWMQHRRGRGSGNGNGNGNVRDTHWISELYRSQRHTG